MNEFASIQLFHNMGRFDVLLQPDGKKRSIENVCTLLHDCCYKIMLDIFMKIVLFINGFDD